MNAFNHKTILITGASSGIGEALAKRFARDGARLILVARNRDKLTALAEQLRDSGGATEAIPIVADLTQEGASASVIDQAIAALGDIDVLINNAGVGEYGEYADKELAALERMMMLNMNALLRLTHLVLPRMLTRRSGAIMNIASMAGFQPTPYMSVYGATKAFVLNFSLCLWEEVRRRGIVITCVCPGPVRTGFFSRGGYETRMQDFTRLSHSAEWIAEQSYRALLKKKPFVIPGRLNALAVFFQRFAPRWLTTRVAAFALRPT